MEQPRARVYGGRPVEDRRAERRAQFIDAALTVYAGKGFLAATLSDVCAVARLSRRQFYELFDSTEDLLVAAYDNTQAVMREAVEAALADAPPSDDPWGWARTAMRAVFETIGNDPRRARVAYVEIIGVNDRIEAHREDVRGQWAAYIETLRAEITGLPPLAPEVGQLVGATFIGAVNGLVHRWCLHQPTHPVTELVEMATAVMIALYADDRALIR